MRDWRNVREVRDRLILQMVDGEAPSGASALALLHPAKGKDYKINKLLALLPRLFCKWSPELRSRKEFGGAVVCFRDCFRVRILIHVFFLQIRRNIWPKSGVDVEALSARRPPRSAGLQLERRP